MASLDGLVGIDEMRIMHTLEGSIAAGKSSLGCALHETGKLAFLPEPVEKWRTGYAQNLLQAMYTFPDRWSFTFQMLAFATRAKTQGEILAMTDHSRVLMERSIFSDRNVFARLAEQSGYMNATEFSIYCEIWDFLAGKWAVEPTKIFYLRTPAEVCLKRIAQRARTEEAGISLDFLERIEGLHDGWLMEREDVVVLDGRESVESLVGLVMDE